MYKHIGVHNGKTVYILYRKVPGEDHMCLVVYPDSLPGKLSSEVRVALNTKDGQDAKCFAEFLHTRLLDTGQTLLTCLHKEGYIKKVQTSAVIVTPNNQSKVRLDELNKLIDEIETGGEAAEKLKELDANSGYNKEIGAKTKSLAEIKKSRDKGISEQYSAKNSPTLNMPTLKPGPDGIITDKDIAENNLKQAAIYRMEAERLEKEAEKLLRKSPLVTEKKNGAAKEAETSV